MSMTSSSASSVDALNTMSVGQIQLELNVVLGRLLGRKVILGEDPYDTNVFDTVKEIKEKIFGTLPSSPDLIIARYLAIERIHECQLKLVNEMTTRHSLNFLLKKLTDATKENEDETQLLKESLILDCPVNQLAPADSREETKSEIFSDPSVIGVKKEKYNKLKKKHNNKESEDLKIKSKKLFDDYKVFRTNVDKHEKQITDVNLGLEQLSRQVTQLRVNRLVDVLKILKSINYFNEIS